MTRIAMGEIHRAVAAALQAASTSVSNAESVATAIVAAEAAGAPAQGLRLVPDYCAVAARGRVDGYAVPSIAQSSPAALIVDAGYGFAYPALDLAIEELSAIAGSQGIAMVGIRHTHHCGCPGIAAERLAEAGLFGIMLANRPAAQTPVQAPDVQTGAAPLAFAAPQIDDVPLVAELPGPDVGRSGDPLVLLAEYLAAGLTGGSFATEAPAFFDLEGPPSGVGQLLVAISPGAFGGATVIERFAELARLVASDGEAGQRHRERQACRAIARRDGIVVEPDLMARIAAIARPT